MKKHHFPTCSVISYATKAVDATADLVSELKHANIELLTRDHNGS